MIGVEFMRWLFVGLAMIWAGAVVAEPVRYNLDRGASEIAFGFDLEGQTLRGQVPVSQADVILDFEALRQSSVDIRFDMRSASAGVFFATEAMRSNSVLAVQAHPTARFQSTSIVRTGTGARLEGQLTLRGVTRPVALDARFFRAVGSNPGDLDRLVLQLNGALDRRAFDATGYANLVGPTVTLNVRVEIARG